MSGQPGHFVELKIEGEKLQRGFKCTMPPDAPCRRRPKDYELRESWTAEESTETGFACWAVEWVAAVGIEDAIYGGAFDGVLASVPVSVTYEECVSIEPVLRTTSPDAATAAIERVRALHRRDSVLSDYCGECSDFGSDQHPPGQLIEWPCSTVAALVGAPEPEWEFMVRTRFASHEHVLDSQWMDEETARAIFEWEDPDITRTLFKRRKAGPLILVGGDDVQA